MYTYEFWKDFQDKQARRTAIDTHEAKMNTKLCIAVYRYFGCSGPVTQKQKREYLARPLPLKWVIPTKGD